jgi:PiT family inorganic phosphate transporter
MSFTLLILIIVFSIIFDMINGFHDAANSIATVISTKVLTPFQAVAWAAFFNFLAFWVFNLKVADTVSKTVNNDSIDLVVIFAGVVAGIIWNLLTWRLGIPSSSSHTLMGGFAGAGVAHAMSFSVINQRVIIETSLFIVLAPFIGMIIGLSVATLITHIVKKTNPQKTDKVFRRLQLVTSASLSLGHGGSDSQKVIGIIIATLTVYNHYAIQHGITIPTWIQHTDLHHVPDWVPITCYSAIGIGTLMGGMRIIKTMGTRITKITPFEGIAAETAGSITLFGVAEGLGIPVSTTHTIAGSIMGVGMLKRISAVRWGLSRQLITAWIVTIPASGIIAALIYWLFKWLGVH